MDLFISWSGRKALGAALALRGWIPLLIQDAVPWLSAADMEAGRRWSQALAQRLQDSGFGIIRVTRATQHSPWLLFEAGALAKVVDVAVVCPYLLDLEPEDLEGPLAQFQAIRADRESTWSLVRAILAALPSRKLSDADMRKLFDRFWPDLEAALKTLPTDPPTPEASRSERSLLTELLETVRRLDRQSPSRSVSGRQLAESLKLSTIDDVVRDRLPKEFARRNELGSFSYSLRPFSNGLHYELFDHYDGNIGVEIHIESDEYLDRQALLRDYAKRYRGRFRSNQPYFDEEWANGRGRFVIAFPASVAYNEIADALQELVNQTYKELWP